jgi:hypothetical protein
MWHFSLLSFFSRWAYVRIPLLTLNAGKALANLPEAEDAPTMVAESRKSIRKEHLVFSARNVCEKRKEVMEVFGPMERQSFGVKQTMIMACLCCLPNV